MNSPPSFRRGAALAIAAIILAMLGILTLGVTAAAGDDAALATQRLAAVRAALAAESARAICLHQQTIDPAAPAAGTFSLPDGSEAVVIQPFAPAPAPPGDAIVEGRHGGAVRRMTFTTD